MYPLPFVSECSDVIVGFQHRRLLFAADDSPGLAGLYEHKPTKLIQTESETTPGFGDVELMAAIFPETSLKVDYARYV